ncbi:hypothetical protein [Pasteurella bettyae]|uniref:hypothetical protein n=1 Tax=Pasteurella bettyae TaxID=752 RepID=UPI003D28D8BA
MTIKTSLSNKRFSFSLEKALDYINNRIDEKINLDDLLYFIKDGQVKTVIKIVCGSLGGRLFLTSIGDVNYLQPVYFIPCGGLRIKHNVKTYRKHKGVDISKDIFGSCACFSSSAPNQKRSISRYKNINIQFEVKNSKREINLTKDIYPNVDFFGWFYISPSSYTGKEKNIIKSDSIFIDPIDKFVSASDDDVEIQFILTDEDDDLYVDLPKIEVSLDSIEILKKDLDVFLKLEKDVGKNYTDYENEIKNLRQQLEIKDNQITKLKNNYNNKNIPILLSAYRTDDPLKIAIEVRNKYWANYPDNVKSNTQIRDYIIRDYRVTQTLATEIEKIACPINRKKN